MFKLKTLVGAMSLIWLSMGVTQAVEESVKDKPTEIKPVQAEALDMVSVVGSVEDAKDMPASASYIGTEDIRDQSYSDINRILRKAPGVNIREEDGFGLFPNISFRGVDTTRSAKITVMEDGVLVAPAAYSAPAAYFNPAGGRMSGVEVLKGGSQVMYGPHITGGVMNYLSTPIPVEGKAYLKAIYGSYGEFRSHGFVGDTIDTAHGKVGYLVEGFYRGSDGFKTIDTTPDFQNGDQTGFQQVEPMLRLSWEPNTAMYQKLEVKFGYSSMDADETYLGLTEEDFRNTPYRRYAASRFDNIDTQQVGGFARYFVSPTDNLDIVTTAYYKEFDRNWSKLDGDQWARALAGNNLNDLACLKGTRACSFNVRDNNRSYYAGGVDSSAKYRFDLGITHHELNGGFRYHEDAETRFQHDTTYTQNASGVITNQVVGAPGSQDNRTGETQAYAFFLKDRIELGKFGFTPGMRYEHLYQTYDDRRPASRMKADSSLDIYSGGGSVDYKFTDDFMMFASAHRGFSPPNPESAIVNNFKEETSNAYELGGKYSHGSFSTELTGFYTQFDNLLVVNNIGGGGGPAENFGSVESRGVELAMNFDAGEAFDWGFRNPYFLSFTYTNAEQTSNARSSNSESIFSYGREGNKVPYIPEYALSFGSGLHFQKWGIEVAANYVSATFTSANNTEQQLDGNTPVARKDSRFGMTDEYVIMDVSTYYKVAKGVKILGGVQNASNEEYIVSRQPYGPRPGMPLFAYGGFELDFDI